MIVVPDQLSSVYCVRYEHVVKVLHSTPGHEQVPPPQRVWVSVRIILVVAIGARFIRVVNVNDLPCELLVLDRCAFPTLCRALEGAEG